MVNHEEHFFVEQHVFTFKRKKGIKKTNNAGTLDARQTFINSVKQDHLATKFVQAFASSDIPSVKLNHPMI